MRRKHHLYLFPHQSSFPFHSLLLKLGERRKGPAAAYLRHACMPIHPLLKNREKNGRRKDLTPSPLRRHTIHRSQSYRVTHLHRRQLLFFSACGTTRMQDRSHVILRAYKIPCASPTATHLYSWMEQPENPHSPHMVSCRTHHSHFLF